MAVAVAADGQRVDRIHLVASRHQGADEQATVGLGPDHHLGRILHLGGQQLMHQPSPASPSGTRCRAATPPRPSITTTSW
jgi:hypothetical protein